MKRPAITGIRRVAPWLALLFIVAGCGNAGFDKAGGSHRTPVVLTMANGNFAPQELQAFAAEVARRSGGALRPAAPAGRCASSSRLTGGGASATRKRDSFATSGPARQISAQ